jgi:hypothetical protein
MPFLLDFAVWGRLRHRVVLVIARHERDDDVGDDRPRLVLHDDFHVGRGTRQRAGRRDQDGEDRRDGAPADETREIDRGFQWFSCQKRSSAAIIEKSPRTRRAGARAAGPGGGAGNQDAKARTNQARSEPTTRYSPPFCGAPGGAQGRSGVA